MYLGRALERLGDAALKEQEPDIGAAFLKFAVVTKELSALMKTLVSDYCHVKYANFHSMSMMSIDYRCKILATSLCFHWIQY